MPGVEADIRSRESILLNISLYTDDSGVKVSLSFLFVTKFGVEMPLSLLSSSRLKLKFIIETFINVGLRESLERPLRADF
jgi:hypothetical protein